MSTTVMEPPTPTPAPPLWTAMPGWGIAAELIPPELINARKLNVIRKLLAAAVVVLLLACAGGYYLAAHSNSAAASDLASVQDRTTQLQAQGRQYSGVVAIETAVSQVQTQIAQVMVGDVDLVTLTNKLQSSLPTTMTITQLSITISTAGVAAASTSSTGGAGSVLDLSGLPLIGTITLSGTGQALDDLAKYVDVLKAVPGLVDVLPVSNTASTAAAAGGKASTTFSVTIGITNALLSHRFDVPKAAK